MGVSHTLDYVYDKIGQLKQAIGKESNGSARILQQTGYAYDQAGNLQHRTNNNLLQTFNVNAKNELTGVNRSGSLTVAGLTTPTATDVTVNSAPATLYEDQTFAKEVSSLVDGLNTFTAIAEDAAGRKDTNSITVNLPESAAFAYDGNGNLTGDSHRSFQYDDENQLTNVFVSGSWKSEFVYDGLQRRRVRKEYAWQSSAWVLTNEVRYVYDGSLVIQERDANNTPLVTYTRGTDLSGTRSGAGGIGGLLARTDHSTGKSAFYHSDGSGNITGLANSSELLVAKYLYDPFGFTLAKDGPLAEANTYRFSSKELHAPSGLYYYGFRYYDPGLQRWINEDPIGELGGFNLHAFIENDPLNAVDYCGMEKEPTLKNLLEEEGCGIDDNFTDPETGETLKGGQVLRRMGREVGVEAVASAVPGGKIVKKLPGKTLRKRWEEFFNKKWPKDPKKPCRNQDACHKKPWADNKTDPDVNHPTNIEPKPHDEHMKEHMDKGDFKRWGERSKNNENTN